MKPLLASSDKSLLRGLAALAILCGVTAAACGAYTAEYDNAPVPNIRAPIVGDMAGIRMKMPWYFAEFAEYEGEPTWEPRKKPLPIRTQASKLVSFGLTLRHPDMAELATPELRAAYRMESIYTRTWLRARVNTGSQFGLDGALDRQFEGRLGDKFLSYKRNPGPQFGLETYRPSRIDARLSKGALLAINNDLFVHRDHTGKVDTLIVCSNVEHAAASCTQQFKLDPAIKVWLSLNYRREYLGDWKIIASQVRKALLKYRVDALTGEYTNSTVSVK